jgi:hypothetical protein
MGCLEFASVIERTYFKRRMTIAHYHRGPHIALECSLPSEVTAISPFVDKLMLLLRNCGCIPEAVSDVEPRYGKPWQTLSFTEIMKIVENTSMLPAAASLTKCQLR